MNHEITDPIMNIVWRDASELTANGWNPNYVMDAELRLLETSILRNGWIQPVLITTAGMVIDGFHRWRLSLDSKALRKVYNGRVPCAVLDISENEAKMLTVRINRAKGTHAALLMSELVQDLVAKGLQPEEIARGIGATTNEVDTLSKVGVFALKNVNNYRYSRAWAPANRLEKGKVDS